VSLDAWVGLLETHKQLTRALDAELDARHGLSLSGVELLGRLAAADDRQLRLSALAAASGLSLSRVSRIVDQLERRGLVERRQCDEDARAVNACLTPAGEALAREAQATHLAIVRELFYDRLDEDEIETLTAVFGRFAPDAAETCTTEEARADSE
jgi:DNA-binding MarR family transcriptional regulator